MNKVDEILKNIIAIEVYKDSRDEAKIQLLELMLSCLPNKKVIKRNSHKLMGMLRQHAHLGFNEALTEVEQNLRHLYGEN